MDEPKKRVIDVTTPGEPSATSRPVIPSSQPPVADPTLAPAAPVPKKITIADEPAAPVLPSMTGPTVVSPNPPTLVESAPPSQPVPVEPPNTSAPLPADDMQNIPRFGELQPKIDSHPLFSGTPDPAPKKPRRWLRRLIWIASALLVLLIAAYLLIDSGVVRGASHLPFHIFKQPVAATTTPAITPIASVPLTNQKYLDIKEWGVRAPYSGSDTLSYRMTSGGNSIEVISQNLATNYGCTDFGAGIINRNVGSDIVPPGPTTVQQDYSARPTGYQHLGSYYYSFTHDQAACSTQTTTDKTAGVAAENGANDFTKALIPKLEITVQ